MGQLEKYGLYVLCLVIFLILGVALWGDPPPAQASDAAKVGGQQMPLLADRGEGVRGGPSGSTGQDGGRPLGSGKAAGPNEMSSLDAIRLLTAAKTPPPAKTEGGEAGKTGAKPAGPEAGKGAGGAAARVEPPKPTPDVDKRVSYTIRSGDTLGGIAMKQLGSIFYTPDIERLNPGIDALRLKVGSELVLPGKSELRGREAPSPRAESPSDWVWYTVERGDSYERISLKLFHDRSHAKAIQGLNPTLDPLRLRPQMEIKVPVR